MLVAQTIKHLAIINFIGHALKCISIRLYIVYMAWYYGISTDA